MITTEISFNTRRQDNVDECVSLVEAGYLDIEVTYRSSWRGSVARVTLSTPPNASIERQQAASDLMNEVARQLRSGRS